MKTRWMLAVWFLLGSTAAHALVTVENAVAQQTPGTKLVTIGYDVSSDLTNAVSISLQVYVGSTEVVLSSLTGDVGGGVSTGIGKSIVWDAGADWHGLRSEGLAFWILADDGTSATPAPVPGMVVVPAGTLSGNDPDFGEFDLGSTNRLYVDQSEVTIERWNSVHLWATANGYDFDNPGTALTNGHPVTTVSWHDSVKWCNARSEMEGLAPCYTVAGSTYRSGLEIPDWNAAADGYRLPTAEEWEYAARAGTATRFPFGNAITHKLANYFSSSAIAYDVGTTRGFHPDSGTEAPRTRPAGSFAPNGHGMFETAGNVWEWCWDAGVDGTNRIYRGGGWLHGADSARSGSVFSDLPANSANFLGFRAVRNADSSVSGPAVALVDAQDYTLTVLSEVGTPSPTVGLHVYTWGSSVDCSVDPVVIESDTVYISKGWIGSGSIAATGTNTTTGPVPLTDTESTIVWRWLADNDYDGLPNEWETAYSGSPTGIVASADSDLDGYTDGEEFLLGTDPGDPSSNFDLMVSSTTNETPLLAVQTSIGCTYTIEYTDSLTPIDWQELVSFAGTGFVYEFEDFKSQPIRMYRVKCVSSIVETFLW